MTSPKDRRTDEHLRWQLVSAKPGEDYRIFRTEAWVAAHPDSGDRRQFSIVAAPDWVNVIALTPNDEVVLVRQYRHGTEAVTLEIPGGAVDDGEPYLDAAKRELQEETGCVAASWESIGLVHPNPAFQTNACATFLARGAKRQHEQATDPGEVIDVELKPLAEMRGLLTDGTITHSLVVAAFAHLMLRGEGLRRSHPE